VAVSLLALLWGEQRPGGFPMSFATFGPLPTPLHNPISGLPALEAAIQRLEATIPTPAGQETGGTPLLLAPTTPASAGAGGTGGSAVWQAIARLLVTLDPDIRYYLQRIFERVLEAVESDLRLPPERRQLVPVPYLVQYLARPRFQQVRLREQDQRGIDDLLRQALWRAVDALEAAALLPEREVYLGLLTEQCARFSLVYAELKKRARRLAALWIAQGELRLLRHRSSRAAEQLLSR
jgi:hypothetical protein